MEAPRLKPDNHHFITIARSSYFNHHFKFSIPGHLENGDLFRFCQVSIHASYKHLFVWILVCILEPDKTSVKNQ